MTFALEPLPPPRHPGALSRLALEEAAAFGVSPELAPHLADCDSCRGYLEALRAGAQRFLASRPSARFVAQVTSAARARRPGRAFAPWAAVGLAAALLLGPAGLWAATRDPLAQAELLRSFGGTIALKGDLASVFALRGGAVVAVHPGELLHPGDALRFVIRASQGGYAAVLERDSLGKVTVVAPFGASEPQAVSPGGNALTDSAILDGTLGKDRFVAIFAPSSFPLAELVTAAASGRPVSCPGCQVETLEFDKLP